MGRNADKRREKRNQRRGEARKIREEEQVQRVAAEKVAAIEAPKPVWARLLARDENADRKRVEHASLDRMLFHLAAGFASAPTDAPWSDRLAVASEQIASWIPADTVSVALMNEGELELCSLFARFEHDEEALKSFLAHQDVKAAFETQTVLSSPDVARDHRFPTLHGQKSHVGSMCVVPFETGVLFISRKEVGGLPETGHHNFTRIARGLGKDITRVQSLIDVFTCSVTGLRSRAALLVDLPLSVCRAKRFGAPLSAILFEIADLANILSTYGQDAERWVLETLGERLRGAVRSADAPTRLGRGSIIFVVFDDLEGAKNAAQRLAQAMTQAPIMIGDVSMSIKLRVGVSELGPDDDGFTLLASVEHDLESGEFKLEGQPS